MSLTDDMNAGRHEIVPHERQAAMQVPLQVTFRDVPQSAAVDADIRKHAAALETVCDDMTSCRVTIESPARHKHQGRLYAAHVDVTVPAGEIVSTRGHEHEDLHVAIRDAFEAVRRRLEDHVRRRRGQVKLHRAREPDNAA
jgi:ribosome-associated translation inhibitor RaiA